MYQESRADTFFGPDPENWGPCIQGSTSYYFVCSFIWRHLYLKLNSTKRIEISSARTRSVHVQIVISVHWELKNLYRIKKIYITLTLLLSIDSFSVDVLSFICTISQKLLLIWTSSESRKKNLICFQSISEQENALVL